MRATAQPREAARPEPLGRWNRWPTLALGALIAGIAGCQSPERPGPPAAPAARIGGLPGALRVDGRLDEAAYAAAPVVERFVVAGAKGPAAPATRAWLFWTPERLVFAFECEDARVIARPPSAREKDVDTQDRVELFLWSGRPRDAYYCLELAPGGAVHDYRAHFYRRFEDDWSPAWLRWATTRTPRGYCVEGELSRPALAAMGFALRPGETWRLGLFRADFASDAPGGEPTWITWVDHGGPPDFHRATSFGRAVLVP